MDLDFDKIENYVRSEEYISFSEGNTKYYFGPKCKDTKQFKLKLGDRLVIKKILCIVVQENRRKKLYWEIKAADSQKKNYPHWENFEVL